MSEEYVKNPYDHFKSYDILTILKPLLDSGNFFLRPEDGKFKVKSVALSADTPWVYVKHVEGIDCALWHQITFNAVSRLLPPGQAFVPRHCQSCWKVVVKPRTLQQLFSLYDVQKRSELPCKCGIETRDSVNGLYGGYFYNKSLEEGLGCYENIKNRMAENEFLAPLLDEVDENGLTKRIILKRGCTEFEHLISDSSTWTITPEQEFIENLIEQYVVNDNFKLAQPEHIVWHILRTWIEWAWKNGDDTYAKYTGGKPLYPAYVTYHQPELLPPQVKKGEN